MSVENKKVIVAAEIAVAAFLSAQLYMKKQAEAMRKNHDDNDPDPPGTGDGGQVVSGGSEAPVDSIDVALVIAVLALLIDALRRYTASSGAAVRA